RARALARRDGLPDPRYQSAADDRQRRLLRMLPARERRRHRSLRARPRRDQGRRPPAGEPVSAGMPSLRPAPGDVWRPTSMSTITQQGPTMAPIRISRTARCVVSVLALAGAGLQLSSAASAQTLEKVKARGTVNCGVNPELLGFSTKDAQGNWSGFDVDFCRAIAAAIFNDPKKVQFIPLSTTDRLSALQADRIDVLSRNTTWTLSREVPMKLTF